MFERAQHRRLRIPGRLLCNTQNAQGEMEMWKMEENIVRVVNEAAATNKFVIWSI